mgnify:FL=1
MKTPKEKEWLFLDSISKTYVYDATDIIMGRLASKVASQLLKSHQSGSNDKVIIINVENSIISGGKERIVKDYKARYELNHPRKGPFYPRMPDRIFKRSIRGMLPYQKKASGRSALKAVRCEIGCPSHLSREELPENHVFGDLSEIKKALPERFMRLGEVSIEMGAPGHRWKKEKGEA